MIKKSKKIIIDSTYLTLPTTSGYIVEFETDEISKQSGNKKWKEVLCTQNKKDADNKAKELRESGLNARVLEAIY